MCVVYTGEMACQKNFEVQVNIKKEKLNRIENKKTHAQTMNALVSLALVYLVSKKNAAG